MHPYLLKGVSLGPTVVKRLVELIPASKIDTALSDDRFTIREVVAHLADWEVLFRARMELAHSTPGSPITTYDEGERAIERNYSELDLQEQLDLYAAERAKTVAFLSSLTPSDFRLTYVHPAMGVMVIEDQANMLVGHDMYHVEQLAAYLNG
jgi:hypothetical protein